jgi:hypothetical protein
MEKWELTPKHRRLTMESRRIAIKRKKFLKRLRITLEQ